MLWHWSLIKDYEILLTSHNQTKKFSERTFILWEIRQLTKSLIILVLYKVFIFTAFSESAFSVKYYYVLCSEKCDAFTGIFFVCGYLWDNYSLQPAISMVNWFFWQLINIYCVKLIPQCILLYGTVQRFNKNCLCSCKPTVGWNDIELFVRFSKTDTMLPFRFIFLSPIPKNWRILPSAGRQSFHFQKITVT